MVSSVLYHHIIGSPAKTFGELTKEIIQNKPHLTKSYLSIIKSQDKYPNDYRINSINMLDELVDFVEHKQFLPNEIIDDILRECYSFAFKQEKNERYDNTQPMLQECGQSPRKHGYTCSGWPQKEEPTEDLWHELNEIYIKT